MSANKWLILIGVAAALFFAYKAYQSPVAPLQAPYYAPASGRQR